MTDNPALFEEFAARLGQSFSLSSATTAAADVVLVECTRLGTGSTSVLP